MSQKNSWLRGHFQEAYFLERNYCTQRESCITTITTNTFTYSTIATYEATDENASVKISSLRKNLACCGVKSWYFPLNKSLLIASWPFCLGQNKILAMVLRSDIFNASQSNPKVPGFPPISQILSATIHLWQIWHCDHMSWQMEPSSFSELDL